MSQLHQGLSPLIIAFANQLKAALDGRAVPKSISLRLECCGDRAARVSCSWREAGGTAGETFRRTANLVTRDQYGEVLFEVTVHPNPEDRALRFQSANPEEIAGRIMNR